MKILWIPHAPIGPITNRSDHIVERLARRHEMRMLSFKFHPAREPWRYASDLWRHRSRAGRGYHEVALHRFPKLPRLTGFFANRLLEREIENGCEAIVLPPSTYITGKLDLARLKRRCAIICDLIDGGDWEVELYPDEREYSRVADAVMGVSHFLTEQARKINPHAYYVPNGVEVARYRAFAASHETRTCKIELGLDPESFVVSIIGMTFSARLYFIDAAIELARQGRNVTLLLVGASRFLPEIRARAGEWAKVLHIAGAVPYAQVLPYFMASDVGLYAADDTPYYHVASPLKIFEYGAIGKPVVVAPRLDEVMRNNLGHVTFCAPDAASLAQTLAGMMDKRPPPVEVDLMPYDWDALAAKVEDVIRETVARTAGRRRRG
jgi:glycosyltransferase involved in cell wall biosynthesis